MRHLGTGKPGLLLLNSLDTSGNESFSPYGGLACGSDGALYGTSWGGTGDGTVFRVTTNGVVTTLAYFGPPNGVLPYATLIAGRDGAFYGTTYYGGAGATNSRSGGGTIFRVTTNGILTTIVTFTQPYGTRPENGLVQAHENGTLTTLVSFNFTNGAYPYAQLVRGEAGGLYGTTSDGGDHNCGTVFRVTTGGVLTTLASFATANKYVPEGPLVFDGAGLLFGTTYEGGRRGGGNRKPRSSKSKPTGAMPLREHKASWFERTGCGGPDIEACLRCDYRLTWRLRPAT